VRSAAASLPPNTRAIASRAIERYTENFEHEELLVRRGRRSGLTTIVSIHSTVRGPSCGGCRMWTYEDTRAAVRDALRLSRAMTFKSAVADNPLGGGKGVIMLPAGSAPPQGEARRDVLLDFAETVHVLGGRYVTAEDVGTSDADMEIISEGTPFVSGLSRERGGSGDPSPWTALGCQMAIEVACEAAFGTRSLEGRSISLTGLGRVGGRLARLLAAQGARLMVSDIDEGKRALADEIGATWTDPVSAITADVDVLAPCALGGLLNHESIAAIRARVVAGAANNQLASDDVAGLLGEHGILWAPDFVANAGGIINIAVEREPGGYSEERAEERVRGIADTMRLILDKAVGGNTLAAAMELARERLAQPSPTG
jgi:leucine dehydrogenase